MKSRTRITTVAGLAMASSKTIIALSSCELNEQQQGLLHVDRISRSPRLQGTGHTTQRDESVHRY